MSNAALVTNDVQLGQNSTASLNFTLRNPESGTMYLSVGNSGSTTLDALTILNTGIVSGKTVTQPTGDNSQNFASTAFVASAVTAATTGVSSFNTRTGTVTLDSGDILGALGYVPPAPDGTGASGSWSIKSASASYLAGGAAGSLPYQSATNTTLFIAAGAEGNVLTMTSGVPAWGPNGGSSMIYPSAGIANSTGSGWATSYSTSGSGTVIALATSPTFVAPYLGQPLAGDFSAGTFTWPTFNQNTTGNASTATNATNSAKIAITATSSNAAYYPTFVSATSGNLATNVASGLTFNPASGTLIATTFQGSLTGTASGNVILNGALGTPSSGVLTNCTGTASGLTAGNVTTNANLTGVISSSGNTTTITSQTGTGTTFVVDTSPTLVTPNIGTPSAGVLTHCTGTASGLTAGNATSATTAAGLTSATTTVVVSGATAPTLGQVLTASSSTAAAWVTPISGLTYPPSGVPKSTGSSWAASYSTSGTGTVLALAASPVFTTPTLGTVTSGDFSAGTFTWPTFNQDTTGNASSASALKSATTLVSTAAATAPTNGQVLTATTGTTATWQTPIAVMVYPGAGIPNSSGSAWNSSYTTTGSGTVVALATSPTFVTPILGTPTSGNLVNCSFPTLNQSTTGNAATVTTNANLTGDVTSIGNAATVVKINGTSLARLATGILKNTTSTGVPIIAVAADFPTLNQNTTGTAANVTGTVAITNGGTGAILSQTAANNLVNRVNTITSSSTPTPVADTTDTFTITALAASATFGVPTYTTTPVDGQILTIRIKDNGTAQTLAWNSIYRAIGTALPSTTTISKLMYITMFYNVADTKWDVVGVARQS